MSFLHLTAMKKERGREICVALETKESQDSCNNVFFSFVIYNKGIHIILLLIIIKIIQFYTNVMSGTLTTRIVTKDDKDTIKEMSEGIYEVHLLLSNLDSRPKIISL